MGDRRRGGLGSAVMRHRVAAVCCSAGALLAFAAGSPAHADIDDLIDTVLSAATTGVDHAGGALDGFVPGDFDPAGFEPADVAAPDDIATALAGAADSGTFTDPVSHLAEALAGGGAQLTDVQSTDAQLADVMRQLDESWINTGLTESHGSGFLYGDGSDHGESGSAAASVDAPGPGQSTDGQSTDGQDSHHNGDHQVGHNDGNNSGSGSSNMPKLNAPSLPKGGSGGNGGGGNGNGNGGNNNAKTKRTTTKAPGGAVTADPYGP